MLRSDGAMTLPGSHEVIARLTTKWLGTTERLASVRVQRRQSESLASQRKPRTVVGAAVRLRHGGERNEDDMARMGRAVTVDYLNQALLRRYESKSIQQNGKR